LEEIVVYVPKSEAKTGFSEIVARLTGIGYRVTIREASDIVEPIIVGPFGKVEGFSKLRIIVSQLAKTGKNR